jgi:hypothetical protein
MLNSKKINEFFLSFIPLTLVLNMKLNGLTIILLSIYSIYHLFRDKTKLTYKLLISIIYFIIIVYTSFRDYLTNTFIGGYIETSLGALFIPIAFLALKNKYSIKNVLQFIIEYITTINVLLLIFGLYRAITNHEIIYGIWSKNVTDEFYKNTAGSLVNWGMLTYTKLIEYIDMHPAYYGLIINIVIVILISLFKNGFIKKKKFYPILIINIFFLILLSSKSNLLALIVYGFMKLLQNYKYFSFKNKVIVPVVVTFSLFSLLLIPSTRMRIERSINTVINKRGNWSTDISTNERIILWESAIKSSKINFAFGLGNIEGYKSIIDFSGIDKNTHNQYLQVLVNSGIVGLLFFIFYLFAPLYYSKFNRDIVIGFIFFTSINLFTENLLDRQWGIVIISFFYGMVMFNNKYENEYSLQNEKSI